MKRVQRILPGAALLKLACGGLVVFAVGGCEKEEEIVFVPPSPPVEWTDIARGQSEASPGPFEIVVPDRTQGVFPASVAVARVAAVPDYDSDVRSLVLHMEPEVEFLSWNSIFDDFRGISEVFPMNVMSMDGMDITVDSMIQAAAAMEAGLLLIYGEQYSSACDTELRGVLYQIPSGQMLALIQASAYVADPISVDEESDPDMPAGLRESLDPRLLSIRGFEINSRVCMLALMANDDPAETVAPEGWIPDRPIGPIIWPPTEDLLFHRRR